MKITTVDAFTNKPFSGNPAGVCITEKPLDQALMQKIANELNLAETAFVYPIDKGFHLRWFTPTTEVQLCGHATLATSHALWEQKILSGDQTARFQTLSGELTAIKRENFIELDFPAIPTEKRLLDDYIKEALNVDVKNSAYNEKGFWIAEVENEETVRRIKPDLKLITKTNSVFIVTAKSGSSKYDFVSRVFVPAFGIDEDPVTGAAHCGLALYWNKILGKNEFTAYQASQRGGELKLKLAGDRVKLIGEAITVLNGNMNI
jgi:PhzF family phenazine biosynthesis protein